MIDPQEELLDLVNENDEVIGTIPRSLADTDAQYIHREIAILIYDENNRVLAQQRSHHKKSYPLHWIISVAGHVPAGVDPLATAHQELREELGFDTELNFVRKDFNHLPNQTMFSYVYKGQISSQIPIKIDPTETEQARFFSEKDLDVLIAANGQVEPGSLQVFRDFWAGKF